uniref:Peroxidase 1 (Fragments) n=1 Tax=Vitis vinifera TaxID=29760 RepID=PER1_VITVI|nr:RecName: Full=Peroxidase 1 [Vitis vinifera]
VSCADILTMATRQFDNVYYKNLQQGK